MADKITQQIIEALTCVAAEPGGLPLYSSKSDTGLFPNTSNAKLAAQKCLADDLIRATGTNTKGKSARDLYALTDKGWEFLLAAVNPKQVLEDFVRVLEARQGEVSELLDTARRMADSLQGLKEAVSHVLPIVREARIERQTPALLSTNSEMPASELETTGRKSTGSTLSLPTNMTGELGALATGWKAEAISPPTEPGRPRGIGSIDPHSAPSSSVALSEMGIGSVDSPAVAVGNEGVGLLEPLTTTDLASAILAHLADHSGPTDCTLPELFRALTLLNPAPSIGEFHDCLRTLHADGVLSLHSWTGPLYALPEPQYALLVGHGIAYYASLKSEPWVAGIGP